MSEIFEFLPPKGATKKQIEEFVDTLRKMNGVDIENALAMLNQPKGAK